MRLVESAHYSDAALNVYMKIKALGQRPEGCTAGIATLASYLGLSSSTVERAVAQLRNPAPDGVVELPENRRRSLPGGRGTTARRRVRPMSRTERYVWLPVHASENLSPRSLRAYAVLAYAEIQGAPLSEGDLARLLRHHSGSRAGRPISVGAAGRIIDRLAATRWITVSRRAGVRGRHLFLVHNGAATAPGTEPPAAPRTSPPDEGSGSDADAGSLAYKEDHRTDRPDDERRSVPSAEGDLTVVAKSGHAPRRRRPGVGRGGVALRAGLKIPRPPADGPVHAALSAPVHTALPTTAPARSGGRVPLTFSPRVDAVLEPVRMLLGGVGRYVLRRIGREIGRQLDDGASVDRMRARLTQRLARTFVDQIRDPGRWLLGVALPRWGCADPDCETGVLWSTGVQCRACAEFRAARRYGAPAAGIPEQRSGGGPVPVPVRSCCPTCERLLGPGRSGECGQCSGSPVVEVPAACCPGVDGMHCGRPVAGGLCWRCRTRSLTAPPPCPERPGRDATAGSAPRCASAGTALWAGTG
ncbi:hypothetical protein ACFCZ1_35900 [Streptomyces sp. NPDC056224]|uniref:hypothetical protein n=1 Tax=Streptomyces sp. NPDC056224 TaxID=3345750 RepID=UPI0035D5CBDA